MALASAAAIAPAGAATNAATTTPSTALAPAATSVPAVAHTDFNGDGYDDLLVAAPGEGTGPVAHTGAITVIPGSASGLAGTRAVTFTPCTAGVPGPCAANARWGSVHAVGDFNHDGYSDVAIFAPQTVGNAAFAGTVTIMYGSPTGLTTKGAKLLSGALVGVPAAQRTYSLFGAALAAGDFNGDGYTDLAIGAPGATVAGRSTAGLVIVLRGSATGLSTKATVLAQGTNGVAGVPTVGNAFGEVLAASDLDGDHRADLIVGVPHADVGITPDAGEVYRFWGSASGVTAAGQALVIGNASPRRHLGAALAIPPGAAIYAAAPGNGSAPWVIDSITAGRSGPATLTAVYTDSNPSDEYGAALLGADLGIHFDHSLVIGAPGFDGTGKVDAFDHHDIDHVITASAAPPAGTQPGFGATLAAGDFNGDGAPDLVIGEPDATVGGVGDAGQLIVMYSNGVGPDRSLTQLWNQESPGIPSLSETGDEWGWV